MTESYFKRLRALSLKAFCTTSIALSFIFNLVFFFSQSKRGCISLVHPSYISVFSDGKHESFFLHLMTHKVFSLTSQPLAWNVQESSQTGISCLHTKGFFPLSLTSWLFNCHKTLPLTGFILPGVHHLSFYMSTITLVFLLKEGSFYILMSYIRWRKRSCLLPKSKMWSVLTIMVSWLTGQRTAITGHHMLMNLYICQKDTILLDMFPLLDGKGQQHCSARMTLCVFHCALPSSHQKQWWT